MSFPSLRDAAVDRGSSSRRARLAGHRLPGLLAIALVIGVIALGQRTDWRLSTFSDLFGSPEVGGAAWCEEHSISESICVECRGVPPATEFGWCKLHGIPECPHCHVELAQLAERPVVTAENLQRIATALDFAARAENNSRCQSHRRRIQLASAEALADVGVEVAQARRHTVVETISAPGAIGFDPTQVARISPRVSGVVWRIDKRVGDKVRSGELLALVDSAEVGKAKAEFQQALTQLELRSQSLARRRPLAGQSIAGRVVQAAEAEALEAQVHWLANWQALINLGLPVRAADFTSADPRENAERLRYLGLDTQERDAIALQTPSNNLLPIRAPFDGEVIESEFVPGEAVGTGTTLFVVANTQTMWLTINVALEHAGRVCAGQPVRFQHEGHADWDQGVVSMVGRAVDESTRTVPVTVELPNVDGRHVAGSFGTASIRLREESDAVVVPSSAIHWEGDCYIVFVRDKDFEQSGSPKLFHVRKVRPGVQDLADGQPVTEVIAGLLPGEKVASANSGILRSELLRSHLGAGCADHHH
jgi:cobalt-zinc-cadmium efflux system membrane fusion protein